MESINPAAEHQSRVLDQSHKMGREGALRVPCMVLNSVSATTFSVQSLAPDTAGGRLFEAEMGEPWTLQMLQDVRTFIVQALSLSYREVDHVTFIVEDFEGAAYNNDNEIHVATQLLESFASGDLRLKIKGLMFHELCHSFQNNKGNYGEDSHFTGMIEGIATFMELAAGYGVDAKVKGGNWFDGYHITAHFLAWIEETQRQEFVNLLNQRMGLLDWNDDFFVNLTGKDVDSLWALYQTSF